MKRISLLKPASYGICGGLLCWACSAGAENGPAPVVERLDPIVVTAKKRSDPALEERVRKQVEAALRSDSFFYDGHVTVTIKDGVVTLQGMVFDDWDLRQAMRISKRIAGVRRVINDLEIELGGD
jgi:hypothetical protein